MIWESITSKENRLIRHIVRLGTDAKYRRTSGEYICEGEKLLWEALRDGAALHAVLWEEESLALSRAAAPEQFDLLEQCGCRLVSAPKRIFETASILETFSGPLFVCGIVPQKLPDIPGRYIVLDRLQDPGNVGTIIRTADAFSIDGIWLLDGTADPYQPKTVRAAMGSIFRVPLYRGNADSLFETMAKLDVGIYAAALSDQAELLQDISLARCAVMIGNEGRGVSPENLARCRKTFIIPMSGKAESLNAAVAASITMWEMSRCR